MGFEESHRANHHCVSALAREGSSKRPFFCVLFFFHDPNPPQVNHQMPSVHHQMPCNGSRSRHHDYRKQFFVWLSSPPPPHLVDEAARGGGSTEITSKRGC